MAQLVEAIEGMAEACRFFETPITGGNVSLYNETLGEGIYPTPVMGDRRPDEDGRAGRDALQAAGPRGAAAGRLGRVRCGAVRRHAVRQRCLSNLWGLPPALDMDYEKRVQAAVREIARAGLAESAHDLSDGGLAVALAECSFGPAGVGAEIDLDSELAAGTAAVPRRAVAHPDFDGEPERVAEIAARHGVEAPRIGVTMKERIGHSQSGIPS